MIRLDLPKEPYWIDLPHGVRVRVHPLSTAMYEAARAKGVRRLREILDEQRNIRESGGEVVGLPDLTDEDAAAGFSQLIFAQALARAAIIEWQGVGDAEGKPLAASDPAVAELMMVHRMAEAFVVQYTATHERLVSEGNASGPSPNGTSAAAPNTAKGAATREPPAPAAA